MPNPNVPQIPAQKPVPPNDAPNFARLNDDVERIKRRELMADDKKKRDVILDSVARDHKTVAALLGYLPDPAPIVAFTNPVLPPPFVCGRCGDECAYVDIDEMRGDYPLHRGKRSFCHCEEAEAEASRHKAAVTETEIKHHALRATARARQTALGFTGRLLRYRLDADPAWADADGPCPDDVIYYDPRRSDDQARSHAAILAFVSEASVRFSPLARWERDRAALDAARQKWINDHAASRGKNAHTRPLAAQNGAGGRLDGQSAVRGILESVGVTRSGGVRRLAALDAPAVRGLVLCGPNGVGKTMLATAGAWRLAGGGVRVVRYRAADLLDLMRADFGKNEAGATLQKCIDADVLVLDDLGKEYIPSGPSRGWSLQQLSRIFDARYEAERPNLITSNKTDAEILHVLGDEHGPAILSRLRQACAWIWVDAPDNRITGGK